MEEIFKPGRTPEIAGSVIARGPIDVAKIQETPPGRENPK
jgi:hypothetical protein